MTHPDQPSRDESLYPNAAPRRPNTGEAMDGSWHLAVDLRADSPSDAAETNSDEESEKDVARELIIGDRIIALFRYQGEWFAIDGMCSHQGGPLADGHVESGCVTCPWHGWQYELSTGVQTINRQPLQETFQVRVIDDRVEVFVPA